MNNEIKTYSVDIIVEPRPALLLTYSFPDQETRRHKRLMPVRDLHRLANVDLDQITGVDVFQDTVDQLKQRHSLHLNVVDNSILVKVIIVLCGLVNARLELDQCLSHADRLIASSNLLKDLKSDQGNVRKSTDGQNKNQIEFNHTDKADTKETGQTNGTEKATGSEEGREIGHETKKKQVRFREKHEEFIFERFDSEESDELIDNLNDKDFLDSMFKNELNYEDMNNNYQPVNYNG